jgi:hypothetical protein
MLARRVRITVIPVDSHLRRTLPLRYISFIGIHTLCLSVTRGYGDRSPLTTTATLDWRRRSDLDGAAAARRGREGAPGRLGGAGRWPPDGAEEVILPLTPDEALVVDVARGLDSGSMIEQAHSILIKATYGVG